jgi:hypothetical protein
MSVGIDLSVVVAASWSNEAVARTVASIGTAEGVEVIVASDPARVAPRPLACGARWVVGGCGDGVPRLRRIGADAARAGRVAFVEDACVVGPGWVEAVRSALGDRDCLAVSGPVFQGPGGSVTDWAVYFAEYALFAGSEGRSRATLAGINFACRRESLGPSPTIREAELSSRLAGSIRWLDAAAVRHVRHYGTREALADRRRFGREFGRERWSDRPGPLRRLGLAAGPAILGVQLARLAACLVRHPELVRPALISGPMTLALLTVWSLGEASGWAEASLPASRPRGRAARRPASFPDPALSEPAGCKPPPDIA